MADQTQADEVGGTQQAPMPSADQQTSEVTEVQAAAPSEVSAATYSDPELSGGESERTAREFERLKSQLREERTRRQQLEQASYQQPKVDDTPLYDPSTGFVDVNGLEVMRKTATTAEKRAMQAETKLEKYIQTQQEQEAYNAHPELNPDARGHDSELFRLTRAIITDSMMNPEEYGGKELTAKQAADLAKKQRGKVIEQAKQEAATEAIEQLTPKEQASLEATGRSDRRVDTRDFGDLVERTRRNDLDAISQRLKNIG
jgi:hypothetical protein